MTIQQVRAGRVEHRRRRRTRASRPAATRSRAAARRSAGGRRGTGGAARPRVDAARRPGLEPDGRATASSPGGGKTVTYGDAARRQDASPLRTPAGRRRSRSPSTRLVGTAVPRIDIPAKVNGTHPYVTNIRVPGMLHGRVVRPRGQGAYGVHRQAPLGRRELDQAHPGRPGRPQGQLPRRRRAEGVRRDPGGRAAEGEVGRDEAMPGTGNLWKHFREAKPNDRLTAQHRLGRQAASPAAATVPRRATRSPTRPTPRSGRRAASPTSSRARPTSGAQPGIYSTRTLVAGLLGRPGRRRSRSTSPRARAATAATSRTTRRARPR